MDSDSDVQAYLNQLSRKTHRLKHDTRPWEEDPPSSPSVSHVLSDLSASSDLSDHVPRGRHTGHTKKTTTGLVSDITALSDKYGLAKGRKSGNRDAFSTLEEKYLRKYNLNTSAASPKRSGEDRERGDVAERSQGTKERVGTSSKLTTHTGWKDGAIMYDSEDPDDDNLARYLNEVTLSSDRNITEDGKGTGDDDDSSDDIINLRNIVDVGDILGAEEGQDSDPLSHSSPVRGNNNDDDDGAKYKSTLEQKLTLNSVIGNKDTNDKQKKASTNILAPSHSSLFYSRPKNEKDKELKEEEEEGNHNQQQQHSSSRLLLSQTGGDLFHSTRRKSSASDGSNKKADQRKPKQGVKGRSRKHKGVSQISIPSASESQVSEEVPVSAETEGVITSISAASERTQEPSVVSEVEDKVTTITATTATTSEDTVKGGGGSREASNSNTKLSTGRSSSVTSQKNHKPTSAKKQKSSRRNRSKERSRTSSHRASKERKSHNGKRKGKDRVKRKSRKHRSPSSSSSSSVSSSSETSYSEPLKSSHHKSHSSHRRSRRSSHRHWHESPYLHHSVWPPSCCCGLHPGHAAAFPHSLPLFTGLSSGGGGVNVMSSGVGLEVKQVMQQQVALVRQFLETQQEMYQAYTSTLTSSYRYTSIRRTEKYIKKRKPPLSFAEAYRLVKQEMEVSET